MLALGNIFKSRTVWTLIVTFALGGLHGLTGYIDAETLSKITMALTLVATWFRINPKQ